MLTDAAEETKQKLLVLLGSRRDDQGIFNYARKSKTLTALMANKISLQKALDADLPYETDIYQQESVWELCSRLYKKFNLKFHSCNEYSVPLAAIASEKYGHESGVCLTGAKACRDKLWQRRILAKHGLSNIRFHSVTSPEDLKRTDKKIPLPCIVKPVDDAGSRGVIYCKTHKEVLKAVQNIANMATTYTGQLRAPEILIEEFINGQEFSIEACTQNRNTSLIAITQKTNSGPPFFIETGHFQPARLPEKWQEKIRDLIISSHKALSINNVVTHTEIKMSDEQAEIVEINGRPGGDFIPDLTRLTVGTDLLELGAHIALDGTTENFRGITPKYSYASIRFLLAPYKGTIHYREAFDTDDGYILASQFYPSPGETVKKTTDNFSRLGYVLAAGNSSVIVQKATDKFLNASGYMIRKPQKEWKGCNNA